MFQIQALYKRVGEKPEPIVLPKSVQTFQELVGGYVEPIHLGEGVYMLCNEDGKLLGLEPNFSIGQELIVGNVLFVSSDGQDFTSLTTEQINMIIRKLFGS